MTCFEVTETCDLKYWMLGMTRDFFETFPDFYCTQSYSILAARLLGLSYVDFLKYLCSQGGQIKGKIGYPVVYFKDRSTVEKICRLINKEADKLLNAYKKVGSST